MHQHQVARKLAWMSFVDSGRVFQNRLRDGPVPVLVFAEKTTVATSVAGNAGLTRGMSELSDLEKYHVVVAVDADFVHLLQVTGLFALVP